MKKAYTRVATFLVLSTEAREPDEANIAPKLAHDAAMTPRPHPRTSAKSAFIRVLGISAIAATTPLLVGCYDAEALRKERQAVATNLRLEEIDLGAFRVALPHTLGDANDNIVDFHAFGQVSDNELDAVKRMLETHMPQLRATMLTTVREMKEAAFKEPKLDSLRKNIVQVVNSQLETPAIKAVGFYSFTFTTM